MMRKMEKWMLAVILVCGISLTSCNRDDNSAVNKQNSNSRKIWIRL